MLFIDKIEAAQLAILSALIGIELSEDKTLNEINVIGNFLIDIGSIMVTIAAQRQNQQDAEEEKPNVQDQIQQLQQQLEELKKRIG